MEKKKVEVIRNKAFSIILKGLETGLEFFGYYRKFIANYAVIMELILYLKTIGFKAGPIKEKTWKQYILIIQTESNANLERMMIENRNHLIHTAKETGKLLKSKLIDMSVLAYSDFSKSFKLYVDESKEYGFRTMIYQI